MTEAPAVKKLKLDDDSEPGNTVPNLGRELLEIERTMSKALSELHFGGPVTHVYNPLDYASSTHSDYVNRYGNSVKKILFVGMNPGPFGMAQNGVAFGDTMMVQDWLLISGEVRKPSPEHPKRPIHGLACPKAEVSGTRFWGLWKELCGSPHVFFRNCFVHNYCPFCFMNKDGKNITPPSLRGPVKQALQQICDRALLDVINLFGVQWVVGVGKYGADRAKAILKINFTASTGQSKKVSNSKRNPNNGVETFILHPTDHHDVPREVHVCSIMHPSPINPAANKGWAEEVTSQLTEFGILDLIRSSKP